MSWSSLASNQTISFNNLQNAVSTGVFIAKTSIPASNEQITKADADTYVYLNTGYAPYSGKASNQLVVKSNLQSDSDGSVSFLSDSTRVLSLQISSGGVRIDDSQLFILSEDCQSFTKNRAVAPITTTGLVINIIFGSAAPSETYNYYFYIYDNPTRTNLIYSNTGSITNPASTAQIINLRPSGFTIGAGLYYQLIANSTSCPL
jgi:hypothetical protein